MLPADMKGQPCYNKPADGGMTTLTMSVQAKKKKKKAPPGCPSALPAKDCISTFYYCGI